ncbi:ribosome assembly protein 3, partial [Phenoliferia sp. Uapishka_3]
MAPPATGKPKRKRQRKRRDVSSSPSGSSSSDSSSEDETPALKPKLPTPSASSSSDSSSDASSSSSDESSDDGRGRRKGRGGNASANPGAAGGTEAATASSRRPYPSRSPSPPGAFNPANLPLGQSAFPMLKELGDGAILMGLVPGDDGFEGTGKGAGGVKEEEEKAREEKFGAWWRARLVSEFETELGGLAAEPGLTKPRLDLLLSSLTSLSTLHTTSSSIAAAGNSIWLHDASTAIDPLAALEVDDAAEDWSKAKVGGQGDVEVGEEGVSMDVATVTGTEAKMDVDE